MAQSATKTTSQSSTSRPVRKLDPLLAANLAFLVSLLLHNSDHLFFQDRGVFDVSNHVMAGGVLLDALTVVTVTLAFVRHRLSPLVSTVVGFGAAVGVTLSHVAPQWSAFSDPYADMNMGAYSWTVMLMELAMGVVLGVVGVRALAHQRRDPATAA